LQPIAPVFPGDDLLPNCIDIGQPCCQALPPQNRQFTLGDVQPTHMLWCAVPLKIFGNSAHLNRLNALVQTSQMMDVKNDTSILFARLYQLVKLVSFVFFKFDMSYHTNSKK
jgi:hypothetical protein